MIPCPNFGMFIRTIVCSVTFLFILGDATFAASPGVTATEIIIGQSCPLDGPVKVIGNEIKNGAKLYFDHINATGGIKGKQIKVITYNDSYNPDTCKENTEKLIQQDKVFLLFAYVGTPTSKVAVPLAIENKIPYFAPYTGAEFLRKPVKKQLFNIRASYFQETEAMVTHLVNDKNIKRVSVFYQNDAFGKAGLEGARIALQKRGIKILNKAFYNRTDTNVDNAVEAFSATDPDAIIMISAYQPSSMLIKKLREIKKDPIFMCLSVVGADTLGSILKNRAIGVVVTQVTPFPFYKRVKVVGEYNKLIKQFAPDHRPNYFALEGFINAKALCEVLKAIPGEITREAFVATAEKQSNVDLGDFKVSFSPNNHQGSSVVTLTQIGPGGMPERIVNLSQLRSYF